MLGRAPEHDFTAAGAVRALTRDEIARIAAHCGSGKRCTARYTGWLNVGKHIELLSRIETVHEKIAVFIERLQHVSAGIFLTQISRLWLCNRVAELLGRPRLSAIGTI